MMTASFGGGGVGWGDSLRQATGQSPVDVVHSGSISYTPDLTFGFLTVTGQV